MRRGMLAVALTAVVCGPSHATPIQWPEAQGGNNHWYEGVSVAGYIAWTDAKAGAEVFRGGGGYLATATSEPENNFIWHNVAYADSNLWSWGHDPNGQYVPMMCGPWLGGYQDPGSPPGYPELTWHWVTGETWEWASWGGDEPNDSQGRPENYVQYSREFGDRLWNDAENAVDPMRGYIVEWDTKPPDSPVPEPTSIALLALATGGIGAVLRKGRKR